MLISVNTLLAQEAIDGPVIKGFGAVYDIPEADFATDTDKVFKVVFDVKGTAQKEGDINKELNTAARFLNMHARAGVPVENLHVALVVHNKAAKDLLTSKAYKGRYGVANVNEPLLEALLHAGVDIIFCGQSSHARNLPKAELVPGVQVSLSAMTALIQLQDEGYRLIKF
jgi:intracellular sulfur oxidation DsrE/DsrF family protein